MTAEIDPNLTENRLPTLKIALAMMLLADSGLVDGGVLSIDVHVEGRLSGP